MASRYAISPLLNMPCIWSSVIIGALLSFAVSTLRHGAYQQCVPDAARLVAVQPKHGLAATSVHNSNVNKSVVIATDIHCAGRLTRNRIRELGCVDGVDRC